MIEITSPVTLIHADIEDSLSLLPSHSVDAVITDPPYALDVGGSASEWDRYSAHAFESWCEQWGRECLRIAKPGAWLLSAGSARTIHRMTSGLEDAGWQIIDSIKWIFAASLHRSIDVPARLIRLGFVDSADSMRGRDTYLRSRHEPFVMARAPLDGGLVETIAHHGTATLDVVSTDTVSQAGPCNVIFSHEPECTEGSVCSENCPVFALGSRAHYFPAVYWASKPSRAERPIIKVAIGNGTKRVSTIGEYRHWSCGTCGLLTGSYMKNSQSYSNVPHEVCDHNNWVPLRINDYIAEISHNTVKPLSLMQWMVRLACPVNGLVLDPFMGSGTTVEACVKERRQAIGIDRDGDSLELVRSRLRRSRCFPVVEDAIQLTGA